MKILKPQILIIVVEFLLLLNAVHFTDFSHGFIAPLSLSLSFLFITFELASFFLSFPIVLGVFISKMFCLSVLNYFSKNLDSVLLFAALFLAILISSWVNSRKNEVITFSFSNLVEIYSIGRIFT